MYRGNLKNQESGFMVVENDLAVWLAYALLEKSVGKSKKARKATKTIVSKRAMQLI